MAIESPEFEIVIYLMTVMVSWIHELSNIP